MTVTANPQRRPFLDLAAVGRIEPFVELQRIASHIGLR